MNDTKKDLIEKVKALKKEIEIRDERIQALEESRNNTLESCKILNKEQKQKIADLEKGAKQIHDMVNTILGYLAEKHGEIRIPQSIFCKPAETYEVYTDIKTDEYVIKGGKE